MKKYWTTLICFSILSFWIYPAHAQESSLTAFTLKDQFDRTYTEASLSANILVVIEADKEGSQYTTRWGKGISDALKKDHFEDRTQVVGIADLQGVPPIFRDFVKGTFPHEKALWTLMDWEGLFATKYALTPNSCNILIFDGQRKLVQQTSQKEIDSGELQRLITLIEGLLKANRLTATGAH